MLDKHTRKKKPDGDKEKHPRLKYTIRPHITQDQEPEPVEPLPATSGLLKEEITGIPEEWILETENRSESSLEKPAGAPLVPLPEIRSAIKSAMKSALHPPPFFPQKPSKRSEIQPVLSLPDEPSPMEDEETQEEYWETRETSETDDLSQYPDGHESTDADEEPDAEPETHGIPNPPYCKDCGKRVPPIANFCPGCGSTLGVSFEPKDHKRKFL